eukprot:5997093-Prorocentrum_lima.AAC.1
MALLTGIRCCFPPLGLGEVTGGGVGGLDRSPLPAWLTLEADRTNSPGGVVMGMHTSSNC